MYEILRGEKGVEDVKEQQLASVRAPGIGRNSEKTKQLREDPQENAFSPSPSGTEFA
jgi:hypothetical protein